MDDFDASAYTISIVRRAVDDRLCFVGTVREFRHIRVYKDSWADAYQSLQTIIEDLFTEACELHEVLPAPFTEQTNYSGRVTAQLPRWLHARLDAQAKMEEVSLSAHVLTLLTIASTNRAYAMCTAELPGSKAGVSPESADGDPRVSVDQATPCI